MYDVIIIGAGISGACVARELARFDVRVLVLEKGYDVCAGTSRGNSATVHSGHDAEPGSNKAKYNVLGNAMYDALCKELSVPFTRNGTVIFATSDVEMSDVRRLKAQADLNGVPGVRVMNRDSLLAMEPYGDDVVGGLFAPSGGMVSPYGLVIALCENAAQNGVVFRLNTRVTSLERGRRHWRVKTDMALFEARCVFNCAGTHADIFNNMVSAVKFNIIPRKGEHIIMDRKLAPYVKATVCQTPTSLPGGGHTKGMGIMPSVDGTVILGCNAVNTNDRDNADTTAEGIAEIIDYFERNWRHLPIGRQYPVFPRGMTISAFGGVRAHSDTDDFILGEAEDAPGFFNVAGIESPGLTAAPAIARELVRKAAEKFGFRGNASFNPCRHWAKPFREMTLEERVEAVRDDPDYAHVLCRCEQITRAEVLAAIRAPLGARSVNAVKMRTRAGMGRCQGGFCGPEVLHLLSAELGVPMTEVVLGPEGSNILMSKTSEWGGE